MKKTGFLQIIMIFFGVGADRLLAVEPVNTGVFGSLAVKGYDVVAYFEDGKPVEGSKDFTHTWQKAEYRFASAAHRDLFVQDPARYAPQYGGYCAWAVSQGYTAAIDPEAWKVVDGKLYLNYDKKVQAKWETSLAPNIQKADQNWPKLLSGK